MKRRTNPHSSAVLVQDRLFRLSAEDGIDGEEGSERDDEPEDAVGIGDDDGSFDDTELDEGV